MINSQEWQADLKRQNDLELAKLAKIAEEGQRKLEERKRRMLDEVELANKLRESQPPSEAIQGKHQTICKVNNDFLLAIINETTGFAVGYIVRTAGEGGTHYPALNGNQYLALDQAWLAFRTRVQKKMRKQ